jgi:hypothetical protein
MVDEDLTRLIHCEKFVEFCAKYGVTPTEAEQVADCLRAIMMSGSTETGAKLATLATTKESKREPALVRDP